MSEQVIAYKDNDGQHIGDIRKVYNTIKGVYDE